MKKSIVLFIISVLILIVDLPLALSLISYSLILYAAWYFVKDTCYDKRFFLIFAAGILLTNVFLFIYTHFQNFIPFWDYAGYYIEGLNGRSEIYSDTLNYIKSVYISMLESDYTKLPAFFTAPFFAKLSGSYASYIILNFNFFIVPFYFVLGSLVYNIDKKMLPLVFLFPPFLNPLVRGYIDAIGLLYAGIWIYVIYKDEFEVIDIKKDIILALLSVVFVFTRRWYLFFLVALFISEAVIAIIRRIADKKYNLKNVFLNFLIIGSLLLVIMLSAFMPYMKRLFTNGFSDTYSAYMFGDIWWNIKYFIRYYGVIIFLISLSGAVLGIINRKTRWFTLFLIIQCLSVFIMFTRIQTISYHHQYLFAVQMLMFAVIGVSAVKRFKNPLKAAALAIVAVYALYTYVPLPIELEKIGFTGFKFAPKTAEKDKIIQLKDRLNELCEKDNGAVYILSSSELLNDDILKNSELPYNQNALHNLYGTAHVDKRDGFPNCLLVAKYIVVATPLQVHLGDFNQRVVAYFVDAFSDGSLTPNLTEIEKMDMGNGITAHILRRDGGYSEEFLNTTKEYFTILYPDYPNLTNIDMVYSRND